MVKTDLFHKFLACLTGIGSSLCLLFFIYSHVLQNKMAEEGDKIFQDLLNSASTGFAVINQLNQLGLNTCSEENLLQMRKAQFKSNDIRDIGFFIEDTLICTTGAGILTNPVKERQHHFFHQGHKFWFGHTLETLDQSVKGVLIRKDKYNIVLSFNGLLDEYKTFNHYQIVAKKKDNYIHLHGEQGIFQAKASNDIKHFYIGIFSHALEFCDPSGKICIAIKQQNFTELKFSTLLIILFIVSVFTGITVLYIYDKYINYLRSMNRRIISGLPANRFIPHYQAIVELKTGKVIGCELLARFEDKMGPLYPDKFIPVVSELNLSWPMTEYFIRAAIKDFSHIQTDGAPFYLSINVFPKDINNQDILKALTLLENIPADLQVCFEVTEDEKLHFNQVSNTLEALSATNIQISIDDFGTGYSNLSQLKLLDIDTLKIDKSFVDEIETGSIRSTFIPTIISIAEKLKAEIVAEGVENKLQVNELLKMNIKYGQGWYFAKALPFSEFQKYLTDNSDYRFTNDKGE
ncbi:EAL domain-containing protein [Paraglaciecola sp. L3A3]|uniref:EAL domain-containing protein n=1 Tax=Paraglaciecola sp. L3A3 TaxID=2686358 RepID=UPI00131B949D|nr:EAL domain-containing protein [Paraglaciecola sp. L3A3]